MAQIGTDTCDWCSRQCNNIQTNGSTFLCPSCCPSIEDSEDVPENAPPSWHHMDDDERQDWLDGLNMEEIIEKYKWNVPPERPVEELKSL